MTNLAIPSDLLGTSLAELSLDQLLQILELNNEDGIKITFAGKDNARRIARAVRPRVSRPILKYCVGGAEHRASNMAIEGDNLQAMATLYKERGQVDLILTDPPYNTGKDFRYNDRWTKTPTTLEWER